MAKKNKILIDVKVDDKGTTKKVGLGAKQAGKGLDDVAKSSRTADRNIKGVANASSNTTKNFSKMSQGTGGLVGAYASLAAQLFAVSAAFLFLKSAGQLEALKAGQIAYSGATGIAMKTLTNDIIKATEAQITFTDASQAAAIGIASGLNPDQLKRLGKAAKDVSQVLGRDVTDSFNRLVRGVTKAEPELLDELGIILRLKKATEDYGLVINKHADDLTAFERTQAVVNEVLEQSEEKYSKILKITGGSVNEFAQLGKAFDDIINKIKELAAAVAGPLATVLIDKPWMAFAAIGLLMKPVLLAVLPGLANIATSTAAVALAAETSFNTATKEADKYQKSLNKLKPVDTSKATAGVSSILTGAGATGSKKSILEQAKAGKQLSNRQIKVLRDQIAKKKLLLGKEKGNFLNHLKSLEVANSASNKRMAQDWEMNSLRKTKSLTKFKLHAKATFATITRYGSMAARGLSIAFSALGWIGLIATLGMVVYEFFKTKEAVDEVEESFEYVQDKIKSVNEELKHFNEIQNVLNDTGKETISNLKNIGGALSNVSLGIFTQGMSVYSQDVVNAYQKQLRDAGNLHTAYEMLEGQKHKVQTGKHGTGSYYSLNSKDNLRMKKENAAIDDEIAALQASAGGVSQAGANTLASGSLVDYMAGQEGGPEMLKMLKRESDMILLSADAKITNSKAGQAYVQAIRAVLLGTADSTDEVIKARENWRNFATEVGQLTKVQRENADAGIAIRKSLFPENKYDKYLTQLGKERVLQVILRDSSEEARPGAEADIARLDAEVILMTKLNDQLHRQNMEKQKLKLTQMRDSSGVNKGYGGTQFRKDQKVVSAEQNTRHLTEQLALKMETANADNILNAIEIKAIENLGVQIALAGEAESAARDAANEWKQIGLSMGESLESSMGKALNGIVQGTMSMKEAFASMAKSIIIDISKMIVKMLVFKMLQAAVGGTGFGDFLGIKAPTERYGGIVEKGRHVPGYATGGIAKGSTSGYPAILHGTEAVVPLGSGGRSIPVDLKGSGGSTNNIVVNISTEGQSSKEGSSGPDMDKLGTAVATAVQVELQNQKRSGGILNPYGVA